MSSMPFETSRQRRRAQSEEFLDAVAQLIDWQSLEPQVTAIEAKIGMRISQPLLRLGLLCHWLAMDPHELENDCRERPALGRFVSSASYGPLVDLWVYQQLAPRMQGAAIEFAELADAIEDELAAHGYALQAPTRELAATLQPEPSSNWAESTVIIADALTPWRTPFEASAPEAADGADAERARVPMHAPRAIVLWPWGDATDIDVPIRIGRDPEFSPYAQRLDGDRRISRRHVVLEPARNGVIVRDAGSSNGTVVDQVRIGRMGSRLVDGDCVVRLGTGFSCKIVFCPSAITA